jgi:hypothetical protein
MACSGIRVPVQSFTNLLNTMCIVGIIVMHILSLINGLFQFSESYYMLLRRTSCSLE